MSNKSVCINISLFVLGLSLLGCGDDQWIRNRASDNAISFQVTSGQANPAAFRTAEAPNSPSEPLQPLVLKSPELQRPIYLHTYVAGESERATGENIETRSTPVNNLADFSTVNGSDGFEVSAFYAETGKAFMSNAIAKKASTIEEGQKEVWNTTPVYYWPGNDRTLCFHAFAPLAAKDSLKNLETRNSELEFDYTVPNSTDSTDAEHQPDLMFALKECSKATSTDGKAPLNFRHALSAVKFAIRDVVGGTVKSISIKGVAGKGHCVYKGPEATGDKDTFAWTGNTNHDCVYTQKFDYETGENYVGDLTDDSKDIVLNDKMPEKTFMLIPQDISGDAEIEITFVRASDSKEFKLSGKIRDNSVTRWEPGKEYTYTVSTSSSNWTYYFIVTGCEQEENDDDPGKGKFKGAKDKIVVNQTVTEGAYYQVTSYRERANDKKMQEPVAWTATASDGTTQIPSALNEFKDYYNNESLVIDSAKWMPKNVYKGNGSVSATKYDVSFYPQMVGTTWKGDWEMRKRSQIRTEGNPLDLSYANGGTSQMNTANCYVVNTAGYYKFPLVYGNAITRGATYSKSYSNSLGSYSSYRALQRFKDYKGNNITQPGISGAASAMLVWQDAYNLISDVKLNKATGTGGYDYVSFKVGKENLQQGNAILAIKDNAGKIIWSWHIWITEHWTAEGEPKLGTGNVVIPNYEAGKRSFTAGPYNLGWCDPKNVWYLKRTGTMKFTQAKSNKQESLNVEQREKVIEYWIGNNTYYQFGRKDPIVGFKNSSSVVKYNFGNMPYGIQSQPVSIKDGIQNPNVLYVGGSDKDIHTAPSVLYDNWINSNNENFYNLWNNNAITTPLTLPAEGDNITTSYTKNKDISISDYFYNGIKTVYDPSPAGYMVPPPGFFRKITNGCVYNNKPKLIFNGKTEDTGQAGYYKYIVPGTSGNITLTGTGHRWYSTWNVTNAVGAFPGMNFNPSLAYLWSSQVILTINNNTAFGLALGYDLSESTQKGEARYSSNFLFSGRRAMARPVRPIKEIQQ